MNPATWSVLVTSWAWVSIVVLFVLRSMCPPVAMMAFYLLLLLTVVGLPFFWLMWVGVIIYRQAVERCWMKMALSVGNLVLVWPACVFMIGYDGGDYVHLALLYPYYYAQGVLNYRTGSAPVRFDWGEMEGFLGGGSEFSLVYDPEDTVGPDVSLGPDVTHRHDCRSVRHLLGSFYKVTFTDVCRPQGGGVQS